MPAAALREQAHQPSVSVLVRRLDHHHLSKNVNGCPHIATMLMQSGKPEEQIKASRMEAFSSSGDPVLVAILWQEIPPIEPQSLLIEGMSLRGKCNCGCFLKRLYVDIQRTRRPEHHEIALQVHIRRGNFRLKVRLEYPTEEMKRLVQIVGGSLELEVRPKEVHELSPMHSTIRGQRKQLDQALGLPQWPLGLLDDSGTNGKAETAKKLDGNRRTAVDCRSLAAAT
jgi:hypothetical protein